MTSRYRFILHESSTGYAVFEQMRAEEIGSSDITLQESYQNFSTFRSVVKLKSFVPFQTAEQALENCTQVAQGVMSEYLKQFLSHLFKRMIKKKLCFELGVSAATLGASIHEGSKLPVVSTDHILELSRYIRLHAAKLLPNSSSEEIFNAQRGLAHAYSRHRIQFNRHRVDNMVIQSIALMDHMDQGTNQLAMRVKEWYGWHFPELAKLVPEVKAYVSIVRVLGDREKLPEESSEVLNQLRAILKESSLEESLAEIILERARTSMGTIVSDLDMVNILAYAQKVVELVHYKARLGLYLTRKLKIIAPNLGKLLDERIAARLISRMGSLSNLAKAPASTIQVLGAEKALFRALKKKGRTPKYGLIFNSSFISRASKPHKGRISRFLANKCAIAARLDCFMENPSSVFGSVLRKQLEHRLGFLEEKQDTILSNKDAMKEAIERYKKIVAKRAQKRGDKL